MITIEEKKKEIKIKIKKKENTKKSQAVFTKTSPSQKKVSNGVGFMTFKTFW